MNILDKLILEGEGAELDFKKTITHPEKIARTMVSFANNKGGILLVGVMDDGYVTGVDAEEEKYMLNRAANFYCQPPLALQFEEVEDDSKTVLLVTVPESDTKPHYARDTQNEWQVYIRVHDQSVLASKLVIKTLQHAPVQVVPKALNKQEQQLVEYLTENRKITLSQYCKLSNISKRRAQRMLITLTLDGFLRQHDIEATTYYTLA